MKSSVLKQDEKEQGQPKVVASDGNWTPRTEITGSPHKQRVCLCSKYKEMYGRTLKSLNIVNLYRGMSKLKLKINVKVPQLLCIVVSVALNGEFERFGGLTVDCCYCTLARVDLF